MRTDGLRLALLAATVMACISVAGGQKIEAQQSPLQSCTAAVVWVGAVKACPTTALKFRISNSGCRMSSGTFTYDYMLVDEGHKEIVENSAGWTGKSGEWEQTEPVTHRCDEEIDDVQNARVTSCRCGA